VSPAITFVVAVVVTLGFSVLLVTRIERVGARLGFTEALLGLTTALAANAPEITSAITALARGQRDIGVSVVLGSNVFNLAALLGLGALVAGRIDLHRRVIVFVGGVSLWIAATCLGAVTSTLSPITSLAIVLLVFIPYAALCAWPGALRRLSVPPRTTRWIQGAISDEESELTAGIHPRRGDWRDGTVAIVALGVVVLASVVMEHSASSMGASLGWSSVVIGGVVLAGVTSLPNAVAAIYFASHGRGSVVLSEALNSNNLNVLAGFLLPAAVLGIGNPTSPDVVVAYVYAGLSLVALSMAYVGRGLGRLTGAVVVVGYAAFVIAVST
jgi:cation:H+ antiporter